MTDLVCGECQKAFTSEEGLQQHRQAKHEVKRATSPSTFSFKKKHVVAVVIVVLLGIVWWGYAAVTGPGTYDAFAQCLTEKGATFYGAFWCPHCQDQKKQFGKSMQYVQYVECSTPDGKAQIDVCKEKDIRGYPTWTFADGSRLTGAIPFEQLSEKTGCPVQ